jgi:hypothetical protein
MACLFQFALQSHELSGDRPRFGQADKPNPMLTELQVFSLSLVDEGQANTVG